MPLSPSRGEMYPFVNFTHNIIKGGCWNLLHGFGCKYCFVGIKKEIRRYYDGPLILHEDELKVQYRPGKTYFIGSAVDMWCGKVFDDDIGRILSNCDLWHRQCPGSLEKPRFLFQSKNPGRFMKFLGEIPLDSTLATTYETNDMELYEAMSRAPDPNSRLAKMLDLAEEAAALFQFMLSIEPIMKPKDPKSFLRMITSLRWDLISIGADSCEAIPMEKQPSAHWITDLAIEINRAGMKVVIKSNCSNLSSTPAKTIEFWDSMGWIYHREEVKAKEAIQESFL